MRIAIVNHSKQSADFLARIIKTSPEHTVAWTAHTIEQATKMCSKDKPDLVILDPIFPGGQGVRCVEKIMSSAPSPILLVTSSIDANVSIVFEAMGAGALDAMKLPSVEGGNFQAGREQLMNKIETIARLTGKQASNPKKNKEQFPVYQKAAANLIPPLLLIGASTGGPAALATILSNLPRDASFAGIIAQHIDECFAGGLAKWLEEQSKIPVNLAIPGISVQPGVMLMAAKNQHLFMDKDLKLYYRHGREDIYSPSINVLFKSIAESWPKPSVAVILTGMGADGAKGIKILHEAGWYTIAQDAESCIINGMPKAAIGLKGVSEVAPLNKIASSIIRQLNQKER